MVSTLLDLTTDFNANGKVNLDLSGWDYCVADILVPAATVSFNATNDANEKTGISNGSAYTAINWQPVAMTNIATGTGVVSTATTGNFKLNVGAKFLQLTGTTASKILIYLTKIG